MTCQWAVFSLFLYVLQDRLRKQFIVYIKTVWLYFIVCYKNNLNISIYMISGYLSKQALDAKLVCGSFCLGIFYCLLNFNTLHLQHNFRDDFTSSIVILWGQSAEVSLGGAVRQTSCWLSTVFSRSVNPNVSWSSSSSWRSSFCWRALALKDYVLVRVYKYLVIWHFWGLSRYCFYFVWNELLLSTEMIFLV